ncbi:conserved hypothetical protein [Neospora caninum Liverpool]|nr:conserved hypothetical protein [Neospora caninum Liverpool]CBZ54264.1 conserved hypothetical protein [Neospora caninum Liverpool]|eukprot:XP_003884295.1 conserved hypothetical protein [Neospora caninum Liverpool]
MPQGPEPEAVSVQERRERGGEDGQPVFLFPERSSLDLNFGVGEPRGTLQFARVGELSGCQGTGDISCASTVLDVQGSLANSVGSEPENSIFFLKDPSALSSRVSNTPFFPGTSASVSSSEAALAATDLHSKTGGRAGCGPFGTGVSSLAATSSNQGIFQRPINPAAFSIHSSPPCAASARRLGSDGRERLLALLRDRCGADAPTSDARFSACADRSTVSHLPNTATQLWMIARLSDCEGAPQLHPSGSGSGESVNNRGSDRPAEDGSVGRRNMDSMKKAEVTSEREASAGGPLETRSDQDAAPTAAQTPQLDTVLNRECRPYPANQPHMAMGHSASGSVVSRTPGSVERPAEDGPSPWWPDTCQGTASASSPHTSPHAPLSHPAPEGSLGCAPQMPLPEPRAPEILGDVAYGSPPAPLVTSPRLPPSGRFSYSPGQPGAQVPLDAQWWVEGGERSPHGAHPSLGFVCRGAAAEGVGNESPGFRAHRTPEVGAVDSKGQVEMNSGSPASVMLSPAAGPAGAGSGDSALPAFGGSATLPTNYGGAMHHQSSLPGMLIHTPPPSHVGYSSPAASRVPGDPHQPVLQLPEAMVGGPGGSLPGHSGGLSPVACPAPGAFLQSPPMGPQHVAGGMMPAGMPSPYCMSAGGRPSSPLPSMVVMGSVVGQQGIQTGLGGRVGKPSSLGPPGMGVTPSSVEDGAGSAAAKSSLRRNRKKPSPRPVDGAFASPTSAPGGSVAGGNLPLPARPPAPQSKRSRKRASAANTEGGNDPAPPRQPRPWQHTARCKKSGRFCTREEAAQAAAEAAAAAEGADAGEKSAEAAAKESENAQSAQPSDATGTGKWSGASGNSPPTSGTGVEGTKENVNRVTGDEAGGLGRATADASQSPKEPGMSPQAGGGRRVTGGKSRAPSGGGAGAGNEGSDSREGTKTPGNEASADALTGLGSGAKEEPETAKTSTPRKRRRVKKDAEAKKEAKGVSAEGAAGSAAEAPRSPVQAAETAQPFSGCAMKPGDSEQFGVAPVLSSEGVYAPQGMPWGMQQAPYPVAPARGAPGACLPYASPSHGTSSSVRYGISVAGRPPYSHPYMSSVYPGPRERPADLQVELEPATLSPATGAAPCQAPLSPGYGSMPYGLDHTGQPLAAGQMRPTAPANGSGAAPPGSPTAWPAQQTYGGSPACAGLPQSRQMGECGVGENGGAYVGQAVSPHSQGMPMAGGFELPYPQMGASWGSAGDVPSQMYPPANSRPEEEASARQGQHMGHSEFSPVKPEICSPVYPPPAQMQDWRAFQGDVLGSQPSHHGATALVPSAPDLSAASPGGDGRECLLMPGSRVAPGGAPSASHLQSRHLGEEHAENAGHAPGTTRWLLPAGGCEEPGDSARGAESTSSTAEAGSAARAVIMGLGTDDGEDPATEHQDEDAGLFQRGVSLSPLLCGYHPLL